MSSLVIKSRPHSKSSHSDSSLTLFQKIQLRTRSPFSLLTIFKGMGSGRGTRKMGPVREESGQALGLRMGAGSPSRN